MHWFCMGSVKGGCPHPADSVRFGQPRYQKYSLRLAAAATASVLMQHTRVGLVHGISLDGVGIAIFSVDVGCLI